MRLLAILQFIVLLFISLTTIAQYKVSELDLDGDFENWYDQKIGKNNAGIISGKYVEIKRVSKSSHQFFESADWTPTTIKFRGQVYDSINLLYDIHSDMVCIQHPTNFALHNQAIELPKTQVESFQLHGHLFRFMENVPANRTPGFFDDLYQNELLGIVVKRVKSMELRQEVQFVENDFYFLKINQTYHRYWGKRTVFRLYKSYKPEIKKFIRNNNLELKPNQQNDADIVELAIFLTSLNTGNE